MKNRNILLNLLLFIIVVVLIASCASNKGPETRPVDEIYKDAVKLYEDEDYLEARALLELIKLQYPASQYADDAQFMLAEIHYKREEFIMAAFHYNLLRRVYPGSEYGKICLFKAAMSHFNMSPPFDRDQEYTRKAIDAFQEFQYMYPGDSLYKESAERILDLRNKLAYREFFTANLYVKMESPNSSIIYYDAVINKYNDTKYYEPAFVGKIDAYMIMKKYDKVRDLIYLYKSNFPKGENLAKLDQILKDIEGL